VSALRVFIRHQIGSVVSTAVDFSTMIAWVELGIGSPVSGTAIGATAGALSNFILGRQWIFAARGRPVAGQMVRYAMVSASGLGWNTLGQALLLKATGLPYPLTRAMIAIAVGVLWNFPLQRWFVFRKPPLRPAPVSPTESL
jgi:putative flippase GtrA